MNTTKTKIEYLDTCLPDYFSGFHNPVIGVPVDNATTKRELVEAIKQEIDECWELYEDFLEGLSDEQLIKVIHSVLKSTAHMNSLAYPDKPFIDLTEEDDIFFEGPYAYFGLVNEEYDDEQY